MHVKYIDSAIFLCTLSIIFFFHLCVSKCVCELVKAYYYLIHIYINNNIKKVRTYIQTYADINVRT